MPPGGLPAHRCLRRCAHQREPPRVGTAHELWRATGQNRLGRGALSPLLGRESKTPAEGAAEVVGVLETRGVRRLFDAETHLKQ